MSEHSVPTPTSSRASSESRDPDLKSDQHQAHLTEASTDPSLSGSSVQYPAEAGGDESTAAEGLPSKGSELHASGQCSRCCFFFKGRCRNGLDCQFCHMPHERRSRGRGCRGHGTQKRKLAAAAQANTELADDFFSSVPRSAGEEGASISLASEQAVEPGLVRCPAPPPGLLKSEAKVANEEQVEENSVDKKESTGATAGEPEAPIRKPPGLEKNDSKTEVATEKPARSTKPSALLSTLPSTIPTTIVPPGQACLSVPPPSTMATGMLGWAAACDAHRPEGVWVSTTPAHESQVTVGMGSWSEGYANNTLCTMAATTPTPTATTVVPGQRTSNVLLATPGNATNVASKAKQIFGTTPGGTHSQTQTANQANVVVLAPATLQTPTGETPTGDSSPNVDPTDLPRLLGFSGGRYGVNSCNPGKAGGTASGGAARAPPPGLFTVPDKKAAAPPTIETPKEGAETPIAAPKKVTSSEMAVSSATLDPTMPVKKRVPAW